jgi:hypothetical protein
MLTECPDCEKPVSTQAIACPACGCPTYRAPTGSPPSFWEMVFGVALTTVVVVTGVAIGLAALVSLVAAVGGLLYFVLLQKLGH